MTSSHSSQVVSYFFFFLSFAVLMITKCFLAQNTSRVPFDVGVVLDLNSSDGKMWLNSMSIAVSDFYATHNYYKTRLVLHPKDSKNDSLGAASAALQLLKDMDVKAIIGPGTSVQANFVVDLGEKSQVPIICFSATSPSLSSSRSPFFVRTSLNDSSQVKAITAIIQAFAWKEIVFISEDTDYGNGPLPYLIRAFQEVGEQVPYRSVISSLSSDTEILEDLQKLKKMQASIFIVHMNPSLGSRLFLMAKAAGMMSKGYAWIITDSMTNLLNTMDSSVIESMQGVLGVRSYVPQSKELDTFRVKWKKKLLQDNNDMERTEVSIYDLWAYDTVWALAMAAEQFEISLLSPFQKPKSIDNSSDLLTFGVSQIGPKLLQIIQKTRFKGISGEFYLIDGQLQSPIFQIINVIGREGREIGFWTTRNGILRKLSRKNSSMYSTSVSNFRVIIWPGDSVIAPRGWAVSKNWRTLKIGVPVAIVFTEFVKVVQDQESNRTYLTGYSIDLFNAALKTLPYDVPYEFVPLSDPSSESYMSYNNMVDKVYHQKLDALVGDVTILPNRSLYVDFTLPYTETGISMVVRINDDEKKNSWVFLEPLSREMWLSTFAAFVFTGCVIWVLEHRINSNFRGSPSQQLGMIFWFSFSTMVFAHREKVRSNLSRLVLIVWVFAVLILTSSYTASLSSTLTVQQLRVSDINQLIRNGDNVGYHKGSYVFEILKSLNFHESKLRSLSTAEEYADALSKGSKRGGVAAIFDEIPYLKLFLTRYCNKYVMVGPTYSSNGFGFVFSKGSPLVLEVSRAILHIPDDRLKEINTRWFGNKTDCQDPESTESLISLSIDSFGGLFILTSTISTFALIVFFSSFLRDHMHILTSSTGSEDNSNITERLVNLVKRFYQSEESSRTSEVAQLDEENQVIDPLISWEYRVPYMINADNIQENGTSSPSLDELRQFT